MESTRNHLCEIRRNERVEGRQARTESHEERRELDEDGRRGEIEASTGTTPRPTTLADHSPAPLATNP